FWEDFLKARMRGLQIVGANSQAMTGLLMGAYEAVHSAADYIICREIQKGEALEVAFPPEGAPYVPRPAAILASSRRVETARAFVDSLFQPEAQRLIAAQHLLPARRDIPLSAIRSRFAVPRALPFQPAEALAEQKTLVRRFQYEVERAALRASGGP
ncbi:MAG: substrate-binding domain-containing protein, partial [Terrimicrobiaceae bacterium]|nr:substrate-binding domain-containing protein [Terrimicrobiaceae bacterium]